MANAQALLAEIDNRLAASLLASVETRLSAPTVPRRKPRGYAPIPAPTNPESIFPPPIPEIEGMPEKPQPRAFGSLRRGMGRLRQGAGVVGLETGDLSPEEAARVMATGAQDIAESPAPPETTRGLEEISQAGTFGESLAAIVRNPGAVMAVVGESLPMSVPSLMGGIAGSFAGPLGTAAGVGAPSAAVEYAASMMEAVQARGVDPRDTQAVASLLTDKGFLAEARDRAAKRGVAIGAFDALTGGLAGQLLKRAKGIGSAIYRSLGELAIQATGGAAGEATAQAVTEGGITSPGEVLLEGVAELIPGVGEVALNVAQARRPAGGGPGSSTPTSPAATEERILELTQVVETKLKEKASATPAPAPFGVEPAIETAPAPAPSRPTSTDVPAVVREVPPAQPSTAAVGDTKPRQVSAPGDLVSAPRLPKRPQKGPPLTLAEFLAQTGVQDQTGELKAMDVQRWHKDKPFRRKLVRDDGVSPDYARESAAEAAQKPADEGLFDVAGRGQMDLVERAKSTPIPDLTPPSEPPPGIPRIGDSKVAARLRKTADGLQNQIDAKRNPATGEQNYTARRGRIMEGMRQDADRLEQIQMQMRALADLHEQGAVPEVLAKITSKAQVEALRWSNFPTVKWDKPAHDRLKKADINGRNYDKAKNALEDLSAAVTEAQAASNQKGALKQRIQAIEYGKGIKDFFQTPEALARRMVDMAEIEPGMEVLEPSAGAGAIAKVIREEAPKANLTVVEQAPSLVEILEEQGFDVRSGDFMERGGAYDRIIMNPPFSNGQDVTHVRAAYEMLSPGGRVVAIMSPHPFFANDKKSTAFRDWIDEKGGPVEDLPTGTFEQTGVSSKLVVIDKEGVSNAESLLYTFPGPLADLRRQWEVIADRVIDSLAEGKYSPFAKFFGGYPFKDIALGDLPERSRYLSERGLTQGKIFRINQIAKNLADIFRKTNVDEQRAVFDYLTTRGANPTALPAKLRGAAVAAKSAIKKVSNELVRRGLLSQESRDKYADAYLPRVYLKHLMERGTLGGGGIKISDQGYLKERLDLPHEYREFLGEIEDPAFLVTKALSIPGRDMAIQDFLRGLLDNTEWVLPQSIVDWTAPGMTRPRKVTPFWLKSEAQALRKRAGAMANRVVGNRARAIADDMDAQADAALGAVGSSVPFKYARLPDSPRYGELRGLIVHRAIANDLRVSNRIWTGEPTAWDKIVEGLKTYNAFWKMTKVPLNPPTQVRNLVSNSVLLNISGVPAHKMPGLYVRAFNEIRRNGKYYRIARKYGVPASTFNAQELQRMQPDIIRAKAGQRGMIGAMYKIAQPITKVGEKAGDLYQFSETLGKTVKIIDAMERQGLSEAEAVQEAQEALFDYSLVPNLVQQLRTQPIGAPFITFYYKAFPAVMKAAIRHPQRLAPYYIIPYLMGDALLAVLRDVDDEDVDKLRMALPKWMRDQGHVYILPYKDASGRWAFTNYGYFLPWAMHERTARNVMQLATGEYEGSVNDFFSEVGILGGPLPQIISALMTGKDAFTGRDIVEKTDPPKVQMWKLLNYAWRMAGPSWLTDRGVVGHVTRSLEGTPNFYGDAPLSLPQAAARGFGVNIYPVDPEASRQRNIRRKLFEIKETTRAGKRALKNRGVDEEDKDNLRTQYREEIEAMILDFQRYRDSSEVHPNLR